MNREKGDHIHVPGVPRGQPKKRNSKSEDKEGKSRKKGPGNNLIVDSTDTVSNSSGKICWDLISYLILILEYLLLTIRIFYFTIEAGFFRDLC